MLVLKIVFWSFFATIVACVEIEAEGKYGWAEKMPTWYRVQGFLPRLFGFFMNGKPLTGYHAFMFFVPLLIFHVPFVSGIPWTGPAELQALAMYFAWSVLWDYHWFVLNPHYAGRFSKDRVWWHKKSPWVFGIFPLDYLGGLAASFIAAGTGSLLAKDVGLLRDHGLLVVGYGAYTVLLHLVAPLYRRWYAHMRLSDDRPRAGITHPDP
jgi:hypothetical protein